MPNQAGVILTGGDFQALAALRALAQEGISVVILDHDLCISRYSRYAHRFIHAPSPSDQKTYIQFLLELADKENLHNWIIIPNSDEMVCLLSCNLEIVQTCYRTPVQCWSVIKNIYIKKNTYLLAEQLGIEIPRSWFPASEQELQRMDIPFPAVIKPSIRDHLYPQTHVKAYRADSQDELIDIYRTVCRLIDPSEVVVQDFIPGGADVLYSFCPFFKEGRVMASITARRSRQHPMTFGHASTFAELVSVPELREAAELLLNAIGYYGVCEVEFMYDRRDGCYKLLEMNPRIWGWHGLAIAAGVNLPCLLYNDLEGRPMEMGRPAEQLKWVRLATDVPTALGEIIKGRMRITDYISSMRGHKTFAVFSKTDPLPFLSELLMLPYLAIKRGF